MIVISKISEMQELIIAQKSLGNTIGLVPTMGYLHEGHISLVTRSVAENILTILSIFVNPIQFGPTEDLDKYPRDLENDCKMAENAGVDIVFAPILTEMYPGNYSTYVDVLGITEGLCGTVREGHFRGVATVVNKLFNICLPNRAYFGQKDFQQVQVIKRMVKDLNMNLEIVVCPIIREQDGLALSSRNTYLSSDEREQATILSKSLHFAQNQVNLGERNAENLLKRVTEEISKASLAQIEYVEIVETENLEKVDRIEDKVLLALAVKFGKTRLIDNSLLEVKYVNYNDEIKDS